MWTLAFWKAAGERAVKTFAQSLVAVMTADGLGLLDANWSARLALAAGATLLSFLTSIASSGLGGTPGPSATGAETVPPEGGNA